MGGLQQFGSGSEIQTLGDDSNSRQKFQSPISKTFAWTLKFYIDIEFLKHQFFVGELATLNPTVEHIMGCALAIWKKIDVILQYKDVAIEVKTADKGVFSCQMVEVLP